MKILTSIPVLPVENPCGVTPFCAPASNGVPPRGNPRVGTPFSPVERGATVHGTYGDLLVGTEYIDRGRRPAHKHCKMFLHTSRCAAIATFSIKSILLLILGFTEWSQFHLGTKSCLLNTMVNLSEFRVLFLTYNQTKTQKDNRDKSCQ